MAINTHGYKMKGLKKVAGETKSLTGGYYSGHYLQLNYNRSTGELFTNFHCSLGQNSWSVYHDKNIVRIGNMSEPHTMQEIADWVAEVMAYRVEVEEYENKNLVY